MRGLSTCGFCQKGKYTPAPGYSSCTLCEAGRIAQYQGHTRCTFCSDGQHQDGQGKSQCKLCLPGYYNANAGSQLHHEPDTWFINCEACDPGTQQDLAGQTACVQCDVGKYAGLIAKSTCSPCQLGRYADVLGSSVCKNCVAGTYTPATGYSLCRACEPGRSQFAVEQTTCVNCAAGTFSSHGRDMPRYVSIQHDSVMPIAMVGYRDLWQAMAIHPSFSQDMAVLGDNSKSRSDSTFAPTQVVSAALESSSRALTGDDPSLISPQTLDAIRTLLRGERCMKCMPGYYQPSVESTSCVACPHGQYQDSQGHTTCISCPVGRYADTMATVFCKACPSGFVQTVTGRSSCDACAPGKFVVATGRTSCELCERGRFSSARASTSCAQCGLGKFMAVDGGAECHACRPGLFSASPGDCSVCPPGKYTSVYGSLTCTACATGQFGNVHGASACQKCAAGLFSSISGATTCEHCAPGLVAHSSGDTTSCGTPPPGQFSFSWGSLRTDVCPPGRYSGEVGATAISQQVSPWSARALDVSRGLWRLPSTPVELLSLSAEQARSVAPLSGVHVSGRPCLAVAGIRNSQPIIRLISLSAEGSPDRIVVLTPGLRGWDEATSGMSGQLSIASAGDVDGDGWGDLWLGTPEEGIGAIRLLHLAAGGSYVKHVSKYVLPSDSMFGKRIVTLDHPGILPSANYIAVLAEQRYCIIEVSKSPGGGDVTFQVRRQHFQYGIIDIAYAGIAFVTSPSGLPGGFEPASRLVVLAQQGASTLTQVIFRMGATQIMTSSYLNDLPELLPLLTSSKLLPVGDITNDGLADIAIVPTATASADAHVYLFEVGTHGAATPEGSVLPIRFHKKVTWEAFNGPLTDRSSMSGDDVTYVHTDEKLDQLIVAAASREHDTGDASVYIMSSVGSNGYRGMPRQTRRPQAVAVATITALPESPSSTAMLHFPSSSSNVLAMGISEGSILLVQLDSMEAGESYQAASLDMYVLTCPHAVELFGQQLANLGDIHGTGTPALAASSQPPSNHLGLCFHVVVFDSPLSVRDVSEHLCLSSLPGDVEMDSQQISSMAGLQDVNGDRHNDVVVGHAELRTVFIVTLSHTDSTTFTGQPLVTRSNLAILEYGASVSSLGDLDGNGAGDFAVAGYSSRVELIFTAPTPSGHVTVQHTSQLLFDGTSTSVRSPLATVDLSGTGLPAVMLGTPFGEGAVSAAVVNSQGHALQHFRVDKHYGFEGNSLGMVLCASSQHGGPAVWAVGSTTVESAQPQIHIVTDHHGLPTLFGSANLTDSLPGTLPANGDWKALSLSQPQTAVESLGADTGEATGASVAILGPSAKTGDALVIYSSGQDGLRRAQLCAPPSSASPVGLGDFLVSPDSDEIQDFTFGTLPPAALKLPGPAVHIGRALTAMGDVDLDGNLDIAVAYVLAGQPAVSVILMNDRVGQTAKSASVILPSIVHGHSPDDSWGSALLGVGDVSQDGAMDLLVGAPTMAGGQGDVFLLLLDLRGHSRTSLTVNIEIEAEGAGLAFALAGSVPFDGQFQSAVAIMYASGLIVIGSLSVADDGAAHFEQFQSVSLGAGVAMSGSLMAFAGLSAQPRRSVEQAAAFAVLNSQTGLVDMWHLTAGEWSKTDGIIQRDDLIAVDCLGDIDHDGNLEWLVLQKVADTNMAYIIRGIGGGSPIGDGDRLWPTEVTSKTVPDIPGMISGLRNLHFADRAQAALEQGVQAYGMPPGHESDVNYLAHWYIGTAEDATCMTMRDHASLDRANEAALQHTGFVADFCEGHPAIKQIRAVQHMAAAGQYVGTHAAHAVAPGEGWAFSAFFYVRNTDAELEETDDRVFILRGGQQATAHTTGYFAVYIGRGGLVGVDFAGGVGTASSSGEALKLFRILSNGQQGLGDPVRVHEHQLYFIAVSFNPDDGEFRIMLHTVAAASEPSEVFYLKSGPSQSAVVSTSDIHSPTTLGEWIVGGRHGGTAQGASMLATLIVDDIRLRGVALTAAQLQASMLGAPVAAPDFEQVLLTDPSVSRAADGQRVVFSSQPSTSLSRCSSCPAGRYCPEFGAQGPATNLPQCAAGRYGSDGQTDQNCDAPCPGGYSCNTGTAVNAISVCGVGHYCPGGAVYNRIAIPDGQYGALPADAANPTSTYTTAWPCPAGHYCVAGAKHACPVGRYESGSSKSSCSGVCSAGYFCPAGSVADKVEDCAPEGASNPSKYYCLRGAARQQAVDTSDTVRGEYTISSGTDLDTDANRVDVRACEVGWACFNGLPVSQFDVGDGFCATGLAVVAANVDASTGFLSMPALDVQLQERLSWDSTQPAQAVQYNLGEFRKWPSCPYGGAAVSDGDSLFALETSLLARSLYSNETTDRQTSSEQIFQQSTVGAAGEDFTCILRRTGAGVCFGSNANGQLGHAMGDAMPLGAFTPEVAVDEPLSSLTAGDQHVCAVALSGRLYCWGKATDGRAWHAGGQFGDPEGVIGLNAAPSAYGPVPLEQLVDQAAAGSLHTCVLLSSKEVQCFGKQDPTLLGATPDAHGLATLSVQAVAIAAHDSATCLLTSDTQAMCWGLASHGRLFGLTPELRNLPAVDGTAVAVAMAEQSVCVLFDVAIESVWCWGSSVPDVYADPETDAEPVQVFSPQESVSGDPQVQQLVAGSQHMCALTDSGSVRCWGFNTAGSLGLTGVSQVSAGGAYMSPVNLPNGELASTLIAGSARSCAVTAGGNATCWGSGADSGALGFDVGMAVPLGHSIESAGFIAQPDAAVAFTSEELTNDNKVSNPQLSDPSVLGLGSVMSCVIVQQANIGQQVQCWGSAIHPMNSSWRGFLGTGLETPFGSAGAPSADTAPPVDFGDKTPTNLAARGTHACAVMSDGSIRCWGSNLHHQLGFGGTDINVGHAHPVSADTTTGPVQRGSGFTQVITGWNTTCGITTAGSLLCWGRNSEGQCGTVAGAGNDVQAVPQLQPVVIAVDAANSVVVGACAGQGFTCAILSSGRVKCWGEGHPGVRAHDGTDSSTTSSFAGAPAAAPFAQLGEWTAVQVVCGARHACALGMDGRVKCWGDHAAAGIGGEDPIGTAQRPVSAAPAVNLAGQAAYLAAGYGHTCAVLVNGQLQCWGDNAHGQCGVSELPHIATAAPAHARWMGGHQISSVEAGDDHTCIIAQDAASSQVFCFGRNTAGQLGIGHLQHDVPSSTGLLPISIPVPMPASSQPLQEVDDPVQLSSTVGRIVARPIAIVPWLCPRFAVTLVTSELASASEVPQQLSSCRITVEVGNGRYSSRDTSAIAVGQGFACFIVPSRQSVQWGGDLRCVGESRRGFGVNFRYPSPSPHGGWVQVDAGDTHICAVAANGLLKCWGDSRVADGGPHVVSDSGPWLMVNTGRDFTCAIAQGQLNTTGYPVDRNKLHCWGTGPLQAGWNSIAQEPGGVLTVDVGTNFACAVLRASGALRCWGSGLAMLTPPNGEFSTVSVAQGSGACALRVSGAMVCWGDMWASRDAAGQVTYSYEYDISTYGAFNAVTVADEWFCARQAADNRLFCRGSLVPRIFRTYSSVFSDVVREFGSNTDTLCVMNVQGRVQCWGSGQLGKQVAVGTMMAGLAENSVSGLAALAM